jgi:hypothetical protein
MFNSQQHFSDLHLQANMLPQGYENAREQMETTNSQITNTETPQELNATTREAHRAGSGPEHCHACFSMASASDSWENASTLEKNDVDAEPQDSERRQRFRLNHRRVELIIELRNLTKELKALRRERNFPTRFKRPEYHVYIQEAIEKRKAPTDADDIDRTRADLVNEENAMLDVDIMCKEQALKSVDLHLQHITSYLSSLL